MAAQIQLRRRKGFTLVELLVVIGIIAVLVAILLPLLNLSRRSAQRIACASNMRQIITAIIGYANNNRGWFPGSGVDDMLGGGKDRYADWIHWEPTRNLQESAIGSYIGRPINPAVLRCPADDVDAHRLALSWGPNTFQPYQIYRYSYCMNRWAGSSEAIEILRLLGNRQYEIYAARQSRVKDPCRFVILGEIDERCLGDAAWEPSDYLANNKLAWNELLSNRHDRWAPHEAFALGGGFAPDKSNPSARGNVAFADGHVDFAERRIVHDFHAFAPNWFYAQ